MVYERYVAALCMVLGVPELERGPLLGADTPEVLSERLGYSGEKIKALLKSGAVQQHP